jgi:hypothetical protein
MSEGVTEFSIFLEKKDTFSSSIEFRFLFLRTRLLSPKQRYRSRPRCVSAPQGGYLRCKERLGVVTFADPFIVTQCCKWRVWCPGTGNQSFETGYTDLRNVHTHVVTYWKEKKKMYFYGACFVNEIEDFIHSNRQTPLGGGVHVW